MASFSSILGVFALGLVSQVSAQYGYTPPVPPTAPTMPTSPYPSYPATTGVPDPGAGMNYGAPNYGGYTPQPASSTPAPYMGLSSTTPLLSYGFLEGFYQYTDFDNSNLDPAHGLGISLGAQLFGPLFLRGGFNWASSKGGPAIADGFDFSAVSLGIGGHIPITQRFHVLCEVGGSYTKLDAKRSSLSFSDGALYVRPGLRFAATQKLELQGTLLFTSADDYDQMAFGVGAFWNMFSMLDLKVGADFGDESTAYKAGLRVRW
jgi:hypothetical protein